MPLRAPKGAAVTPSLQGTPPPLDPRTVDGKIDLPMMSKLRRIVKRAAALALPLALAICLPPLAVIAVNLRAQSASARVDARAAASAEHSSPAATANNPSASSKKSSEAERSDQRKTPNSRS